MQCPPTRPGLKGRKFHFVPAAASTSFVSIPIRWKIFDSSFIKAILISRWEFSITLAASATLILDTGKVPAWITDRYRASTFSAASGVEPDVTFIIFSTVCSLSPGLIRSGEYPAKKSRLKTNPEVLSRMGTHSSSVMPGQTVDS